MTKYPELLDGNPPMQEKRGWGRSILRRLPSIAFPLLVAFLAFMVLWRFVVITVPAGHVGVLWKRFGGGTQLDRKALRGGQLCSEPPSKNARRCARRA